MTEILKILITNNFALLCVAAVLTFIAIQRFKQHPRVSVYTILIIAASLLLAMSTSTEDYFKSTGNVNATLICSVVSYITRPFCVFLFILLAKEKTKTGFFFVSLIPLIINTVIYILAFVEPINTSVVFFTLSSDGTCAFGGGPLRFSAHIVSLMYLIYLGYLAISILRLKHLSHSFVIFGCIGFIVAAAAIETFIDVSSEMEILNNTIAVSTLFYYLYLYIERTQVDALTGLYNRDTYNLDVLKMKKSLTGVIQFDMNGLKFINDTKGHQEGDKALKTIASLIESVCNRNMYAYRMSGDEFMVLANDCDELVLRDATIKFRELIEKSGYYCSVGYYCRKENESVEDTVKMAEKIMYLDKTDFYKHSEFDRRQR